MIETRVIVDSPHFTLIEPERPCFGLYKTIPDGIPRQIEKAVEDFIRTSHVPQGVDKPGLYNATLHAIANASVLGGTGDLWLGFHKGELWTYIIAHVGSDIDHRLSYTVSQAWVREDQRGKPWVKDAWEQVRKRAKDVFAKHFVVISSRDNDKAYCRFLGKGFHRYASILKEDF